MTLKCIARVVRAKTPLADMAMFRVEEDKINTTNTMADPCEDHPVAWADMMKKHHHPCTWTVWVPHQWVHLYCPL